jgi:hypothetical protein
MLVALRFWLADLLADEPRLDDLLPGFPRFELELGLFELGLLEPLLPLDDFGLLDDDLDLDLTPGLLAPGLPFMPGFAGEVPFLRTTVTMMIAAMMTTTSTAPAIPSKAITPASSPSSFFFRSFLGAFGTSFF